MGEIAVSLLPITALFGLFQAVSLKLSVRTLKKIAVGLVYTYIGLGSWARRPPRRSQRQWR